MHMWTEDNLCGLDLSFHWVGPETKLRLSDLVASTFTCWVILLTLNYIVRQQIPYSEKKFLHVILIKFE